MSRPALNLMANPLVEPAQNALYNLTVLDLGARDSQAQMERVTESLRAVEAAVNAGAHTRVLRDRLMRLAVDTVHLAYDLANGREDRVGVEEVLASVNALAAVTGCTRPEWHTPQGMLPVLRKTWSDVLLAQAELRLYQEGAQPSESQQRLLDEGLNPEEDALVSAQDLAGRALGLAASLAAQEG